MATSPDLANEIDTHITTAVQRREPILMGPILVEIRKFCSFRREAATGHTIMSFIMLKPTAMKVRGVAQFIRVFEQRLAATPVKHQPPGDMLFGHLWHDAPSGCGLQGWGPIAEDVKEIRRSSRHSHMRTLKYLLKKINDALEVRREAQNLAVVQRELTTN